MEATRNIQTAFRFRQEMVQSLKNKARIRNMSLNAYVEEVLERDLKEKSGTYEEVMNSLSSLRLSDVEPVVSPRIKLSPEEVEGDERMKYILDK